MANVGRALASVGVLAAFAIGVPAGNIATGGGPGHLLPLTIPDSPERIWWALRWSYLDGSLIPWLAHVLVWCGWALGMLLILVDLVRLLRAGSAAAVRYLACRSPRTWITGLVASAVLMGTASTAVATPAGSSVVATAEQHPEPAPSLVDAYHLPDAVRPDCPRHQVVHGDTYWALAEQHLGDGRRYVEIDALNRDRIPDPHALRPGMRLLLPPDADHLLSPLPEGVREIVVAPGEMASSIAEREFGDAEAWHRLWDLNHLRPQPDGRAWRTPDLLVPGWRLFIAEPSRVTALMPPPSAPQPPVAPPTAPTTPAPPSSPSPPTSIPSDTATTTPSHNATSSPAATITLPTSAFLGIGLAAAVTAAVFTVRLRQRRRPRRQDSTLAPAVRAVRIEYDRATLPRDADGALRYPDSASDAARRDDAAALAEHVLPTEQTVLGLREGQLAAADLAATGGLGLDGPGALPAARALLVALYAQRQPKILVPATCLPLLFETTDTEPTTALTITSDTAAAFELLSGTPELETDDQVVLVMTTPEPNVQAQLENLVEDRPNRILAIVLGPWPSGTSITVAADGLATSSGWAGTRLFSLPTADATELLSVLQEARAVDEPAADEFTAIASETESAVPAVVPGHLYEPRELHLQVLGRQHLRLAGTDRDLVGVLAPRQREILIYLALHPNGCRRETLTADLWPDAPIDRPHNAFHATLSQMRTALRKATDGAVGEITTNIDGHFGINSDLVTVDLWQLENALSRARHALTEDDRLAALHEVANLYTGRLADGFAAAWVEAPREEIHRAALGAISQLVRAVGKSDPAKMLPLLEHARELDPYNENIYRDLMRVHAMLGQHDSIQRTLTLLATTLAEIDERPTDDTVQLAQALSAQRGA